MTIKGYLTVTDVATEFKVHANTVRKWCCNGFIKFTWHVVGRRRQRVFSPAQVEAFRRKSSKPFSPIRSQRSAEVVEALSEALADSRPKRAAREFLKKLSEHIDRKRASY